MRLPGQKTWNLCVCTGLVGHRSYGVKVGERTFIQNRQQLIQSDEQLTQDLPDVDDFLN